MELKELQTWQCLSHHNSQTGAAMIDVQEKTSLSNDNKCPISKRAVANGNAKCVG